LAKFRFVQWLWDWLFALETFSFEWDPGNRAKSVQKHAVTCREAEEVFTERRFVPLGEQVEPPCSEPRYAVLGETVGAKLLFVVFAVRDGKIRAISARTMNRRERKFYASLREE
jgi:uncharacterized DUF497 family protein